MASKIKQAKVSTSVRTTTSMSKDEPKEVPKDAEILSKNVTTETEQIENGWLITRRYDINYRIKGSEHSDYAYYNKKWYSKTDPLSINVDKSLAEAFEDE